MEKNQLVTGLVVGVVLCVIVGMVYNSLQSFSSGAELVGFERWVACESCNEVYWGVLDARPGRCQKCGETQLWAAGVCRDPECGHKFPVNIIKLRREASEAYCPKCKSGNVGKVLDPAPSP